MDTPRPRGIVVFGGGTATNSLVDVFESLRESRNCSLSYIIPISDNGGSSSELIRVFGGPGIGDVRSRLVRLIPDSEADAGRAAIKALFNHRLSSDPLRARSEWLDIVEGRDQLWADMSSEKRELIRSIFNHVNLEIVKRARPSSVFNFAKASIGNLFLTGARVFTGSLESAVYLLSTICAIPSTVSTLPAINSNFTHHICAGLADGSHITGQNAISHPSAPTALPDTRAAADENNDNNDHVLRETEAHDRIEDATLPGSLPSLRKPYIDFSKADADDDDLPARIERIWYINPYGHEIWPLANPKVVAALQAASAVIYSVGSLYTSLVPNLILRGVGAAISNDGPASRLRKKVMILNASVDRETGPLSRPLTATDFVRAIARAGAESQGHFGHQGRDDEVRRYVTHLIYLEGEGVPAVDRDELAALGVDGIRVYGRRTDGVLQYDEAGLARALEAVMGKPEMVRSRRNTSTQ
ncbi:Uu.00g054710.m01.CDS01 [Anthostomella pinea]|uniref:Uu.00g054710.m01.CDS01 n=1 Tax=Anthostomella pinea TaxID=933095 RepID=A0AAI8YPS4_9PEZI|nr:Uu.00g054710.m01.CDS01 [Anthostomella pinea]